MAAVVSAEEYVQRALAAWYGGSRPGHLRAYASEVRSTHVTVGGLGYVVVANVYGPLGVYRIRPNGFLRLLKRWPKAVEAAAGWPRN